MIKLNSYKNLTPAKKIIFALRRGGLKQSLNIEIAVNFFFNQEEVTPYFQPGRENTTSMKTEASLCNFESAPEVANHNQYRGGTLQVTSASGHASPTCFQRADGENSILVNSTFA